MVTDTESEMGTVNLLKYIKRIKLKIVLINGPCYSTDGFLSLIL